MREEQCSACGAGIKSSSIPLWRCCPPRCQALPGSLSLVSVLVCALCVLTQTENMRVGEPKDLRAPVVLLLHLLLLLLPQGRDVAVEAGVLVWEWGEWTKSALEGKDPRATRFGLPKPLRKRKRQVLRLGHGLMSQ